MHLLHIVETGCFGGCECHEGANHNQLCQAAAKECMRLLFLDIGGSKPARHHGALLEVNHPGHNDSTDVGSNELEKPSVVEMRGVKHALEDYRRGWMEAEHCQYKAEFAQTQSHGNLFNLLVIATTDDAHDQDCRQ